METEELERVWNGAVKQTIQLCAELLEKRVIERHGYDKHGDVDALRKLEAIELERK